LRWHIDSQSDQHRRAAIVSNTTGTSYIALLTGWFAEIDLHFHDLRHEAGSRKLEAGFGLHEVSAFLGHADVTTTARYLNVKDGYLQKMVEWPTLVKG
jgi:integrase